MSFSKNKSSIIDIFTGMFRDRMFWGKLLRITLPITFQQLMLALVGASDAFMLGHLEQNAMSAVSLATRIQFVQNLFLGAITAGIGILGAQYWGKRELRAMSDIFSLSLKLASAISILTFLGCELIPEGLMWILTDEQELIAIGARYLRLAGWSYLFTGFSQCYLGMLKVTEHEKALAVISGTAVVLNIILNAIFIYGLLGAPALGVEGAALATLISRIVELLLAVFVSARGGRVRFPGRRLLHRSRLIYNDFYRYTFPLLMASMLWGIGFSTYSVFMGHLGTDAAAANSVVSVVRDIVFCLCTGISAGASIMVGNELGAGHPEQGRCYGDRFCLLSYIIGAISAIIMLLLTPPLMALVDLTPGAAELLWGMMIVMAVYMVGCSVNTVIINGVFTAGGDTFFDVYSLAVAMWGLAVPLAALGTFVFHWSPVVVLGCTCLDEVGKTPWTMLHFRKHKWVRDLTRDLDAK